MAVLTTEEPPLLRPDLLTSVDMSSLSQSELRSLSLLSNTNANANVDAPVAATLNPSLFNESASSRKQTFSDSPHNKRRRLLRRERSESNLIVHFLKRYLELGDSENTKTKTKQRRENSISNSRSKLNESVEIMNRNGEVVDLAAFKQSDGGPFAAELQKRAAGMEREEELLAMLAAMDGKWCSRRKKRRVVQACLLGDALPVGWQLIIALRRKSGRFSPYCRRYISPTGEELASCKEVSSYLQSYFGINDTSALRDVRYEQQQNQQGVELVDEPMPINSEDGNTLVLLDFPNSTRPNACVPIERDQKDVSVSGIDNLPDVRVSDLYECHSCNVSFDVKDEYLQHLMSSHKRTTKKYRLGSSVGAGVIIRDGKFECQFCHKVFEERRRYLGHVGNHVRGSARRSEVSLAREKGDGRSPCKDQLPANNNISRMDALIEIAHSSIQDISHVNVSNVGEVSLAENSKVKDADLIEKGLNENGSGKGRILPEELNPKERPSEIFGVQDETEMGKNRGQHDHSSEESNPPCDMVSEISVTDKDIVNDSSGCFDELEMGKGNGEPRCSSEELNPEEKIREISMIHGNMICPSASCNELGMGKDYIEDRTSPELLKPHDKGSGQDEEQQAFTFDTKILVAENTRSNLGWEYSAAEENRSPDEPKGMSGIHDLLHNEKPSAVDGDGEMFNSNGAVEDEFKHAQEHNNQELATVSVESSLSAFATAQTSLNAYSPFDDLLAKQGRQDTSSLDQNMRPEYMKLDEMETQMYDGITGGDFVSFSAISMGFENNTEAGVGLDACIESQTEFPMDISQKSGMKTICVWCGGEFCHQVVDVEVQPDSVGFMCPTCRNKISKQFNDLESNFSSNHQYY